MHEAARRLRDREKKNNKGVIGLVCRVLGGFAGGDGSPRGDDARGARPWQRHVTGRQRRQGRQMDWLDAIYPSRGCGRLSSGLP